MEKYGGGESGIYQDGPGKINSMIERMKTDYFGHQPFDSLVKKTAFMFQSLLIYHPFVDGLKRTGIYSSLAFLLKNKHLFISTDVEDSVNFAINVADNMRELDPDESLKIIIKWFQDRIIPLDDTDQILKHFKRKGKKFKCPRCSNTNISIDNPYCTDCGLELIGFSITIDGFVIKKDLRFERKPEIPPDLIRKQRPISIFRS
jgi:death-on-curing protein